MRCVCLPGQQAHPLQHQGVHQRGAQEEDLHQEGWWLSKVLTAKGLSFSDERYILLSFIFALKNQIYSATKQAMMLLLKFGSGRMKLGSIVFMNLSEIGLYR